MAKEMNYEALNANLRMIDKKGELAFEQARANGTLTPEQEKFSALISDEAFLEKFFAADSAEEVQALFKENGLELSEKEITVFGRYIVDISKKLIENGGELSEEELEQVAGGLLADFPSATPGERMFGILSGFGGGFGGMFAGGELGFIIGNVIFPGAGGAIGGLVGAIGGGLGGIVGGLEIGIPIAKGVKKIGGWIKSLF